MKTRDIKKSAQNHITYNPFVTSPSVAVPPKVITVEDYIKRKQQEDANKSFLGAFSDVGADLGGIRFIERGPGINLTLPHIREQMLTNMYEYLSKKLPSLGLTSPISPRILEDMLFVVDGLESLDLSEEGLRNRKNYAKANKFLNIAKHLLLQYFDEDVANKILFEMFSAFRTKTTDKSTLISRLRKLEDAIKFYNQANPDVRAHSIMLAYVLGGDEDLREAFKNYVRIYKEEWDKKVSTEGQGLRGKGPFYYIPRSLSSDVLTTILPTDKSTIERRILFEIAEARERRENNNLLNFVNKYLENQPNSEVLNRSLANAYEQLLDVFSKYPQAVAMKKHFEELKDTFISNLTERRYDDVVRTLSTMNSYKIALETAFGKIKSDLLGVKTIESLPVDKIAATIEKTKEEVSNLYMEWLKVSGRAYNPGLLKTLQNKVEEIALRKLRAGILDPEKLKNEIIKEIPQFQNLPNLITLSKEREKKDTVVAATSKADSVKTAISDFLTSIGLNKSVAENIGNSLQPILQFLLQLSSR